MYTSSRYKKSAEIYPFSQLLESHFLQHFHKHIFSKHFLNEQRLSSFIEWHGKYTWVPNDCQKDLATWQ